MTNWFPLVPGGSWEPGVVTGTQVVPVVPPPLGGNRYLGTGTRGCETGDLRCSEPGTGNRVSVSKEM